MKLLVKEVGFDHSLNAFCFASWRDQYADVADQTVKRLRVQVEETARRIQRDSMHLHLVDSALESIGARRVDEDSTAGGPAGDGAAAISWTENIVLAGKAFSERAVRCQTEAARALKTEADMTTGELHWVAVTPPVVQKEAAARLWVKTIKTLTRSLKGNKPTRKKRLLERWDAAVASLKVEKQRQLSLEDMALSRRRSTNSPGRPNKQNHARAQGQRSLLQSLRSRSPW